MRPSRDVKPPRQKLYSRKELEDVFERSPRWVAEVSRHVGGYGGRYDVQEIRATLKAGYRPFRRKSGS